jgi:hypothetical protein
MESPLFPFRKLYEHVERAGFAGISEYAGKVYGRINTIPGTKIFELADWDVLIVLDACRADLLREVTGEYDFLTSGSEYNSVASTTHHWMERNFTAEYDEEVSKTVYVCGNPYSERVLDQNSFELLDEVWQYGWDPEQGTIPPRPITNRAIHLGREYNFDVEETRMIVHYMQPHAPFIAHGSSTDFSLHEFGNRPIDDVWQELQKGNTEKEEIWRQYTDNLRLVLDDVSVLLQNLDASNVLLTSDHGNGFGEFGIYGHPNNVAVPCLRRVPLWQTSASDSEKHEPKSVDDASVDQSVDDRLRSLGYKV